jgi:hypothetical protein
MLLCSNPFPEVAFSGDVVVPARIDPNLSPGAPRQRVQHAHYARIVCANSPTRKHEGRSTTKTMRARGAVIRGERSSRSTTTS